MQRNTQSQKNSKTTGTQQESVLHENSLPVFILLFSGLLITRILLSPAHTGDELFFLRLGIPGLLIIFTVILILDHALRREKTKFLHISSRTPLYAAIISVITAASCLLDILSGLQPLLLLPGMVILGIIYWNHRGVLFFAVSATFIAVAVMFLLIAKKIQTENAFILVLSFLLAEIASDAIRKKVLPGVERLNTLEEENKELWNLSYRDALTGLYNRRYLEVSVEHLFNRAVRYREQLHVLMIDIDHFKKVNDKLGHAVGDEVLKTVAETLLTFVRTTDIVARYGGEEFIIYIVQSNPELTQFIANRIRDGIASLNFEHVPWTITISIGIAGLQKGDTIESQKARSDQFLYLSKRNGRNRVTGL